MPTRQKTVLVTSDDEEAMPSPVVTYSAPKGEWKVPLFSCDDVHNLAMATCCPIVTLAKILAVFGPVPYRRTFLYFMLWLILLAVAILINFDLPMSLFSTTMVVLLSWAPFLTIFNVRYQMREHFNIPKADFQDSCVSIWCYSFTLAQMAIQVEVNTPGQCDFEDNATLIAYSAA